MQLILAGRNTTANLLSYAMLFLARHPEEYARARAEVLACFPPGVMPTFESLKACKILRHILFESLRLLPLTPVSLHRRAVRDTILPRGGGPDESQPIAIRKGEFVRFSQYLAVHYVSQV